MNNNNSYDTYDECLLKGKLYIHKVCLLYTNRIKEDLQTFFFCLLLKFLHMKKISSQNIDFPLRKFVRFYVEVSSGWYVNYARVGFFNWFSYFYEKNFNQFYIKIFNVISRWMVEFVMFLWQRLNVLLADFQSIFYFE